MKSNRMTRRDVETAGHFGNFNDSSQVTSTLDVGDWRGKKIERVRREVVSSLDDKIRCKMLTVSLCQ